MSHRWEYEDEYIQLSLGLNRAAREGDQALYQQLSARKQELDDIMWQTKVNVFTELKPFRSVVDAFRHTALRLGVAFPDLSNPRYRTGDGKFLFGVSDNQRTVQIWPMEDRGYYSVEIFDYETSETGKCYQGQTQSLEEATLVITRWFVDRQSIGVLHQGLPWIAQDPLHLTEPRMSFE